MVVAGNQLVLHGGFLPWPARMVQGLSSSSQVAVTCTARRDKRVLPGYAAIAPVSDHCRSSDFSFLAKHPGAQARLGLCPGADAADPGRVRGCVDPGDEPRAVKGVVAAIGAVFALLLVGGQLRARIAQHRDLDRHTVPSVRAIPKTTSGICGGRGGIMRAN